MNKLTRCVLDYVAKSNIDIDGVSCIFDDDGRYYITIISYKHKLKNTAVITPLDFGLCRDTESFIHSKLDSLMSQYSKELSRQLKKKAASDEA